MIAVITALVRQPPVTFVALFSWIQFGNTLGRAVRYHKAFYLSRKTGILLRCLGTVKPLLMMAA
jgi:hypothetical protein